jgi:hypothetical protein
MNKFITLTKPSNGEIRIQPLLITAMEALNSLNPYEAKTTIHMMGSGLWHVMENADEIQKLIDKSSSTTLTTWETGPK